MHNVQVWSISKNSSVTAQRAPLIIFLFASPTPPHWWPGPLHPEDTQQTVLGRLQRLGILKSVQIYFYLIICLHLSDLFYLILLIIFVVLCLVVAVVLVIVVLVTVSAEFPFAFSSRGWSANRLAVLHTHVGLPFSRPFGVNGPQPEDKLWLSMASHHETMHLEDDLLLKFALHDDFVFP